MKYLSLLLAVFAILLSSCATKNNQTPPPAQMFTISGSVANLVANNTGVVLQKECGHNEWAWMSGSRATNQMGTYGTLGTADAGNTPGGRQHAATWTDSSGDLWLFGGCGKDNNGALLPMNDMWKFSGGEWTWIGGS